jgi:hypothetical protein
MHLPMWGRLLSPRTSPDGETQGMVAPVGRPPASLTSSLHFLDVSYDPKFFFVVSIGGLPSLCEVLRISVPFPLTCIDTLNYDYVYPLDVFAVTTQ